MGREDVELIVPNSDRCGEGQLWDWRRNLLVWADISSRIVYEYDHRSGRSRTLGTDVPVSGTALCEEGGYIIAYHPNTIDAYSAKITGFEPYNSGTDFSNWRFYQVHFV